MDKKLSNLAWYLKEKKWPLFPCDAEKHPLTAHGFKDATLDFEQIQKWHTQFPEANWAIPTGEITGTFVLDVDAKNETHKEDGIATLAMWREEFSDPIETPTQKTGGGGVQYFFKHPAGHAIKNGTNVLGPGIDLRTTGGYVLIPPSKTVDAYHWELHPQDYEFQEVPGWILSRVNGGPAKAKKAALPKVIQEGTRNDKLFRFACSLRSQGMNEDEILASVAVMNQRGDPPLSDDEVNTIVASASKYEGGIPDTTDVANAYRFMQLYKDTVRYCKALDTWFIWDGKRWRKDDTYQIISLALNVADVIRDEAEKATDSEARKALAKGWAAAKDVWNIESFLRLARSMLPVRPEEMDKATAFLNVNNGILNMATGELEPHDPGRYITKLMDVDYVGVEQCPRWLAFLEERVPKAENREYLQRIVGYALSGRSDGKRAPFIYGAPDTGKSTFLETIIAVAGKEYVQKTNIELILASRHGGGEAATPMLRQLFGARMVITSEIPKGRTVNDGVFKDLTGGDSFTARGLHEAPISDRPTHCLVLYGNYKPDFKDRTGATGNRMAVVGFNVIIPPAQRKDMLDVIGAFMEERSGILNWIIEGYMNYAEYGLREPSDVIEARREYETDQDVIQRYLGENCEFHDDYSVKKAELYKDYVEWCKNANERSETRKSFTREVTQKGYEPGGNGRDQFTGLRMLPAGDRQ